MKEKITTETARERAGKIASLWGIILNLLLALAKILGGIFSGFLSLLADGINNLSDCGSSVVSLVSFRLASKPADKEHPFGHKRIEYVATLIIAFFILFLAVELLREAIERVMGGTAGDGGLFVWIILGVSIPVKGGMFFYYRYVATKYQADTLKATATDSACDCLATFTVLIGVLITQWTSFPADGWAGLAVSLFIGWQGVSLVKEMSSQLIGRAPDADMVEQIRLRILSHEGVLGTHDLRVYSYGPGKYFATVHIETDANVPVLEAHELVDEIEREFVEQTEIILTGHLDPIVIDDERTNTLRGKILFALRAEDEEWSMHDFRVVWGERSSNVLFDVTVPFGCKRKDEEIQATVEMIVKNQGAFAPVVTVERE